MKKVICLLLAVLIFTAALTLGGCGKSKSGSSATQATENQGGNQGFDTPYGGMTARDAVLRSLEYVGAGYECVSCERSLLRNQEAWHLGLRASDGSDETVYYVYINEETCMPVGEIPTIGGENREGSGVFSIRYAGICEQDAIFRAIEAAGEYLCVSCEESESDGAECWLVGVVKKNTSDNTVRYFYVNKDSCVEKED